MQVIIYPNETTISIIRQLNFEMSIQEIARKDVPFNVPYLIIDQAEIPTDRTYRGAWTVDFSNPDGVGLGPHRWFIEQLTAQIAQVEAQQPPPDTDAAERFEADREAALTALRSQIEVLKAEVLEIEGVQL